MTINQKQINELHQFSLRIEDLAQASSLRLGESSNSGTLTLSPFLA